MITQLYFEGDPLIPLDPMIRGIPDERGRESLVALLDMKAQVQLDTLAYRWNVVLRGSRQTLFENKLQGN